MAPQTPGQADVRVAVTVRAGQVVAVDAGCFWCGLLDAIEESQGNVVIDLSGTTMSLTPRALDLIVYVGVSFRLCDRRLGIVADGPARGAAEAADATVPGGALDIASSTAGLAALWGAGR